MDIKHIIGGENPIQTDDELLERIAELEAEIKNGVAWERAEAAETKAEKASQDSWETAGRNASLQAQLAALVEASEATLEHLSCIWSIHPHTSWCGHSDCPKCTFDKALSNLTAAGNELLADKKNRVTRYNKLAGMYNTIETERDTLAEQVEELMEFVEHSYACRIYTRFKGENECSCGLLAALPAAPEQKSPDIEDKCSHGKELGESCKLCELEERNAPEQLLIDHDKGCFFREQKGPCNCSVALEQETEENDHGN
ncbi:hypothetical protein LCGC14_0729440 [marine sediment metagenome]|uniref:Uncharacterized protein n=1 Tax=marine sediment metagenome TaxID=412755 RepID=A0A0F9QV14_9ZZZZ